MIGYISSQVYQQTIVSTLKEQDEVVLQAIVDNHFLLNKYVKLNITNFSSNLDIFLIDLSALDDTEEDIINAIKMIRTMCDTLRIVIVAPTRLPGDKLLSELFALGILNIIATSDYLELKEQIVLCISEKGKSFKDALVFKDVREQVEIIGKERLKVVSRVIIGMAGSQPRVGVTHNAIVIANTLRKKGFLVAVVEKNHSGDFEQIRIGYDEKLHEGNYFTMHGVDYYSPDTNEQIKTILDKSYNFIICDFGYLEECDKAEFFKCHKKLILTGSKVWEIQFLRQILMSYSEETLKQVTFCFNLIYKEYEKELRGIMKYPDGTPMPVFFLGYNSEPFNIQEFPVIDKILDEYLLKPKKEEKKGSFKEFFIKNKSGKEGKRMKKSRKQMSMIFLSICGVMLGNYAVSADPIKRNAEEELIDYTVSFVDAADYNRQIFYEQKGSIAEGNLLKIQYPEQIVGSDGYIWKATKESPKDLQLYGSGNQKIIVTYEQGKKIYAPSESEKEESSSELKKWMNLAFEAEQEVIKKESGSYECIKNSEQNKQYINSLYAAINDADRHDIYLIGENYVPETTAFNYLDAFYSYANMDTFSEDGKEYKVIKVGIKKKWNPERCTHIWNERSKVENDCQVQGSVLYECSKCKKEQIVYLPALGHIDSDNNMICDRCGTKQLQKPEKRAWKEGDIQAKKIGEQIYLFRCIDEDYTDAQSTYRKAALFLCESVIRSDVDRNQMELRKIRFGPDNNYKRSSLREWLNSKTECLDTLEPISIGVSSAYSGSTEQGTCEQLKESSLKRHDIGFQVLTERMFCLSLEEALKYRDVLWKFNGSESNNPKTQLSPYSEGYYLRTPIYKTDETGNFRYGEEIYAVDLKTGNIHPVETDGTAVGIRPAFAVPQE